MLYEFVHYAFVGFSGGLGFGLSMVLWGLVRKSPSPIIG